MISVRRFHIAQLVIIVMLCVSAPPSPAYSSYGLGQIQCQTYLDKRGEDQLNQDVTNTAYIHAYLAGYLTAGNALRGIAGTEVDDVSINLHTMVQWLDAWCLNNRSTLVAVALESFWVEAANAKSQLQRQPGNR